MSSNSTAAKGKLTVVATPIGNLGDITLRALDILRACDVIYAEDTRVTSKLLAHFDISGKKLRRLDENSMKDHLQEVVSAIEGGAHVAYCSDAGMPGVSDPGMLLVDRLRQEGMEVEVLPGASAILTAYVASGTSAQRFCFLGFPPRKDGDRERFLRSFASTDAALILYESPNRLVSTLESIASVFPYRNVAVARELTKMHEEVVRDDSQIVYEEFKRRADEDGGIRGEIVVVIDGPTDAEIDDRMANEMLEAEAVCSTLREAGLSGKTLAKALQDICGIPRNMAYDLSFGEG